MTVLPTLEKCIPLCFIFGPTKILFFGLYSVELMDNGYLLVGEEVNTADLVVHCSCSMKVMDMEDTGFDCFCPGILPVVT